MTENENTFNISQDEIDELLKINDFINETKDTQKTLVSEIREVILDSGRLKLEEWRSLRKRLHEIEELIPHIDLIIKLKSNVDAT